MPRSLLHDGGRVLSVGTTCCASCPFHGDLRGKCTADPKARAVSYSRVPKWCPLRDGSIPVTLEGDA